MQNTSFLIHGNRLPYVQAQTKTTKQTSYNLQDWESCEKKSQYKIFSEVFPSSIPCLFRRIFAIIWTLHMMLNLLLSF